MVQGFRLSNAFIITVEKLLYGGNALTRRDDGKAVFIPYAVPGDRLLLLPGISGCLI